MIERARRVRLRVEDARQYVSRGLILGYGLQGYTFYVYFNWSYFYAVKVRGLGIVQAAALAIHQGWGRALDVAVWITLGSGFLFTLVDANRSIEGEHA